MTLPGGRGRGEQEPGSVTCRLCEGAPPHLSLRLPQVLYVALALPRWVGRAGSGRLFVVVRRCEGRRTVELLLCGRHEVNHQLYQSAAVQEDPVPVRPSTAEA